MPKTPFPAKDHNKILVLTFFLMLSIGFDSNHQMFLLISKCKVWGSLTVSLSETLPLRYPRGTSLWERFLEDDRQLKTLTPYNK